MTKIVDAFANVLVKTFEDPRFLFAVLLMVGAYLIEITLALMGKTDWAAIISFTNKVLDAMFLIVLVFIDPKKGADKPVVPIPVETVPTATVQATVEESTK